MPGRVTQTCMACQSTTVFTETSGFFYCDNCGAIADDIADTEVDGERLFDTYSLSQSRAAPRAANLDNVINAEPISQVKVTASQIPGQFKFEVADTENTAHDEVGPTGPSDFGSQQKDFNYDEVRSRYLTGLQLMIQLQCEALVHNFNVSPLIVGLFGPIWLRFLASTGIMADEWECRAVEHSESQVQGEVKNIPENRRVMIMYRFLSSRIPVSSSLAISFLACHMAREAILPTDMLKWAVEGKLPYMTAFREIEKRQGPNSRACPISASRMFRPIQIMSTQKLESEAANIAKRIGLDLPPLNFFAIASRFCRQLSLPCTKILPTACQICEWSMPPQLYLSANEFRIPTRVCVMSILIVAIRYLFDINGYGFWELSLSNPNSFSREEEDKVSPLEGTASEVLDSRLNVGELLQTLVAKYKELDDLYAYSSDLSSYLEYCKNVVFSGLHPSFEDLEEEELLTILWEFYQNKKVMKAPGYEQADFPESSGLNNKRSRESAKSEEKESHKERAIRRMKLEMEENKFCYLSPRTKVKRKDYLHYARKRKDVYIYAVHADYYILLRSCAKIAQVETRVMHIAVLSFERRLKWLEKKMDDSLNLNQNLDSFCDFCRDEPEPTTDADVIELSI